MPSPIRSTPTSQRNERRQRFGGFGLSILLHIAVGLLLIALPETERPEPVQTWEPIEIVAWDEPAGGVGQQADAQTTEPSADAPAEPAEPTSEPGDRPASESAVDPDPTPAGPTSTEGTSRESTGAVAPGVSAPADTGDATGGGGLALSGLRQHSRGDASSSAPEPKVTWSAGEVQHRTGGAVHESVAPRRSDGNPRSLAEAGFKSRKDGRLVYRDPRGKFKAILHASGRIEFKDMPVAIDKRNPLAVGMPGMSEAIRAAQGQELYQKEKKHLLEQTFELRLSLAVAFARTHIDNRLDRLYRDLLEIWQNEAEPPVSRRRLLFERWDECEESVAKGIGSELTDFGEEGSSRIDEIRSEAGRKARRKIEEFIRRHLPRDAEDCFSVRELQELNRLRKSRERFDPYG